MLCYFIFLYYRRSRINTRSSSSYDSTVVEDHSVSKPVREPIVTRSSSGSERVNPDSPDRVIQESPDMFASSDSGPKGQQPERNARRGFVLVTPQG